MERVAVFFMVLCAALIAVVVKLYSDGKRK